MDVLEISARTEVAAPWAGVRIRTAWPSIIRERRILGPVDLVSDLRAQAALLVGLVRHRRELRSAEVVIVEGGLLAAAFLLRPFRRHSRPVFVFDLITLMSLLHRDANGHCTLSCKMRRLVWRVLEAICVRGADVAAAGSHEDAFRLAGSQAAVVPHVVLAETPAPDDAEEDPNLLGFLGNGHVVPNREAIDFIASSILEHAGMESVRCRVVGSEDGYSRFVNSRLEFVGFYKDPASALSPVSVCCAPMEGAGGVSTKVLAYLTNGKRTVCTPESVHGIAPPPKGLWVAERNAFATAVAAALTSRWMASDSHDLRTWMADHHGLPALSRAWDDALRPRLQSPHSEL